jgi:hypothetical protein
MHDMQPRIGICLKEEKVSFSEGFVIDARGREI